MYMFVNIASVRFRCPPSSALLPVRKEQFRRDTGAILNEVLSTRAAEPADVTGLGLKKKGEDKKRRRFIVFLILNDDTFEWSYTSTPATSCQFYHKVTLLADPRFLRCAALYRLSISAMYPPTTAPYCDFYGFGLSLALGAAAKSVRMPLTSVPIPVDLLLTEVSSRVNGYRLATENGF